jgi:hypothetical protein
MIVYKIHNVDNFNDAKPIIEAIKDFNKDKSAIWVPKEWAHVVGIGDFEKTTVISVNNPKPVKVENIKAFLQDAYDMLGGEDFLKEKELYLPEGVIEIEVLEKNKNTVSVKPTAGITVYKVKTEGLNPSMAFDLVNMVRDEYDSVNEIGFVQNNTYTMNTEIFVPESLVDIEVI